MQTAALPQKRDERTTSGRDSPDEADAWLFAPYLRLMSWTFDPVACLACWFNDKIISLDILCRLSISAPVPSIYLVCAIDPICINFQHLSR